VLTVGLGEDAELVLMMAKTGDILTVTRGFNGTAPKAWQAGEWLYRAITAQDISALQTAAGALQIGLDQASTDIDALKQRTAASIEMATDDTTTIKAAIEAANAAIATKTDKITTLWSGGAWGADGSPNITVNGVTNYAQLELLTWYGVARIPTPPETDTRTAMIVVLAADGTLLLYVFRIGRSGNALILASSRVYGWGTNNVINSGVNTESIIAAIRGVNP